MSLHLRLIAVLAIVSSQIQYGQALLNNCFDVTGAQNFDRFACQPNAAQSACCYAGDLCYSSGLCAPGPTTKTGYTPFYVDGCTNSSFSAPACVPNCVKSTGNGLQTCQSLGPNHFCCYGLNGCNCSDPSAVFTLNLGTVVTTIDPSATYTASVSSSTSSSLATTTSSSSPTGTSATTTPSPAPTHGVAIGVGVGVGIVGVAAFAGLGYFFFRRRQSKSKASELSAGPGSQPPPFQEYYNPPGGQKPQGGYQQQEYPQTPMTELPEGRHYQPVGELPGHGNY
ncbi:uncharacterized protein K444DRAFT_611890 [Hyaloscypha bicolor E]|uniref:Mid2 domain-containing protein n=1 Tax=Hyaloscypha bicolor E TaxID=1095630 RepID=A0A2J6TF60_9HELO|nr:uncharacterized protein K444DRAFT_611890 [Hyaloscypha bicolor E]PMD61650.1 hypothetical protein K444DRAFT_611890 [Hyaloscypha bicolor E]